jgi:hypothetical protein
LKTGGEKAERILGQALVDAGCTPRSITRYGLLGLSKEQQLPRLHHSITCHCRCLKAV